MRCRTDIMREYLMVIKALDANPGHQGLMCRLNELEAELVMAEAA